MEMEYSRIMAAGMVFVILCTGTDSLPAYGAEASVGVDETMYMNLDYYGRVDRTNVVKGVGLNDRTEFTGYDTYESVINMSNSIEPVLGDGTITWQLPQTQGERSYYKCAMGRDRMIPPWDFDVPYRLDGIPTDTGELAGAPGLVEIDTKIEPSDNVRAYYHNNMMLVVAMPVDMNKCYSVEAEGSQAQNLGDTTAVVSAALPGEDRAYTIRTDTDSFETIDVIMVMVPGTVEDPEHIKNLKRAKDTWQGVGSELYDDLEQMTRPVENTRQGMNRIRQGMGSAESAKQRWSNSKDNILAGDDQTLAAFMVVSQQMDTMIPHLRTIEDCVEVVRNSVSDIVNTLGSMQDPLRKLQARLKNIRNSTGGVSSDLPEPKRTMESTIALDTQPQASRDTLLTCLSLYKGSSARTRGLCDEELSEEEPKNVEDVDYGVSNGGSRSSSGGSDSQEDIQNNNQGNNQKSGNSDSSTDGKDSLDGGVGGSGAEEGSGGGSTDESGDASRSESETGGGSTDENGGASGNEAESESGSGSTAGGGGASGSETESGSGNTVRGGGVSRSGTGSRNKNGNTAGGGNTGGSPAESSTTSGDTGSSTLNTGTVINSTRNAGNTGDTGLARIAVTVSIKRKNILLVSSPNPQEAAKTIEQAPYEKVAILQELSAQSKSLTNRISDLVDDTSDSARYSAKIIDDMDYLIEDLRALDDSLDIYYPGLRTILDDSREPVWRTTDTLNNEISTSTIVQNTLRGSGNDLDAAARDSLRGSMELLDKGLDILDGTTTMHQAGHTMENIINNELDKLGTDNRFLFMDPSADKVSSTSDRSKPPKTLQIVTRIDEIDVDDDMARTADVEVAGAKENPLRRMWSVLVQMWKAMVSIFKNRQKQGQKLDMLPIEAAGSAARPRLHYLPPYGDKLQNNTGTGAFLSSTCHRRNVMVITGKQGKTEYRLTESVKEYMRATPVDKITVKNIMEECDVIRQTFYKNFLDKYDLIDWYFDKLVLQSFEQIGMGHAMGGSLARKFEFILNERVPFTEAFRSDDRGSLEGHDFKLVPQFYMDLTVRETSQPLGQELRFLLEIYCQGSVYMTVRWILGDMKDSPHKMSDKLVKATPPRLAEVFGRLKLL